jgi:hypothetical protein
VTFRIETDQSKRPPGGYPPLLAPGIGKAGQSENVFTGNKARQTDGNPMVTSAKYDDKGNAVITVQQNSAMPLTPDALTPGIRSDLTFIVPSNGSSITIAGTVSGSPSFEVNVFGPGGQATNIPLQDAPTNPISFPIGLLTNNNVFSFTPLPPPPPPPPKENEAPK